MGHEIHDERNQNGNDNGGLQGKLHASVNHRREDNEKEKRNHREDRVISGTRPFKRLVDVLLFAGSACVGRFTVTVVKPALHEEVPDRHRSDHTERHRDLILDEVRDDVGIHKIRRSHGVRRRRPQVQAAGRTDHGGRRRTGDAQSHEKRKDRRHQKEPETHGRINKECHELADDIRHGKEQIGRTDGGQGFHAGFDERFRRTDLVHIVGEPGNPHDVEPQPRQTRLHLIGEGLREIKPQEMRGLFGGHRVNAHKGCNR